MPLLSLNSHNLPPGGSTSYSGLGAGGGSSLTHPSMANLGLLDTGALLGVGASGLGGLGGMGPGGGGITGATSLYGLSGGGGGGAGDAPSSVGGRCRGRWHRPQRNAGLPQPAAARRGDAAHGDRAGASGECPSGFRIILAYM